MASPLLAPFMRFLGRLSYPRLFALTAALFAIDLVIPDVIPLADEVLLGLGTLLLANWKKRKTPGPIDATRDVPR
ncbi:DUF6116 family protein [Lysobacter sp. CFH 32150]|uniref:DUF6116 family protein n=1 Tax=Lysobacter sp. CFH 32150 TaxID=2927128 RepID=UPI001FA794F4|nr:DUF6116 family protein [Lysobacter sp. CFH 32150]MCI4566501.1 hypothetical protein [Lysobacter sp. CFH 32150]